VECVKRLKNPKNVKELQSVLGLINYYRKFIPKAADLILPLSQLLKKGVEYKWTTECSSALDKLKEAIITPPILRFVDFTKPMYLTTDASGGALGAVLSQKDNDDDFPLSFASRTLNEAEKRYSTIEREFLAIVWAVKSFRAYLLGRNFTVYTDHKPLVGIANLKDQTSRLARFRHKLSEYDFEIKYKPGKQNLNADALSRAFCKEENECQEDLSNNSSPIEPTHTKIGSPGRTSKALVLWRGSSIMVVTRSKAIEISKDADREQNDQEDEDADLLKADPAEEDLSIFLTDPEDIMSVLKQFHDSPLGGHQGISKTFHRIRRQYKWTGMLKQIKDYVKSCSKCQANKSSRNDKLPMVITDTAHRPFDKVFMVIVGPVPISCRINKYILTFQDDFFKIYGMHCHSGPGSLCSSKGVFPRNNFQIWHPQDFGHRQWHKFYVKSFQGCV